MRIREVQEPEPGYLIESRWLSGFIDWLEAWPWLCGLEGWIFVLILVLWLLAN